MNSVMKQLDDRVSMDRFTENEAEGDIIREPDEKEEDERFYKWWTSILRSVKRTMVLSPHSKN